MTNYNKKKTPLLTVKAPAVEPEKAKNDLSSYIASRRQAYIESLCVAMAGHGNDLTPKALVGRAVLIAEEMISAIYITPLANAVNAAAAGDKEKKEEQEGDAGKTGE